ncbi:MAG: alpha/beta fold hydrolase [Gemmatimonadales bacterium]
MRGEFVDLAGSRLYYYAAGTRGTGEPVVFLHGFPASSHLWQGVVRDLCERAPGHRLVVLDQLGFGRSDRPGGAALTADAHAGRVRALMDDLGIDAACLVGHAMGGAVAQAVACAFPGRVTRLCLVNSTAFDVWPWRAARLARWICAAAPLGRSLGAPLLAGLVHGSLLSAYAVPDNGRRSLDHYLHAYTSRLGVEALVAQLRAMHDPSVKALGERLAGIRQPTAIVWGRLDPFLDVSLGERIRDAIPGATLEVIPGARHFSPEDAPDLVAGLIGELLTR